MIDDGSTQIVPNIKKAAVITSAEMMIEPFGEHSFSELKTFYAEKMDAYNAEAYLLKGMPMLADLRAALLAGKKRNKPVYAEISVDSELTTSAGMAVDAALITLQSMGLAGLMIVSDNDDDVVDALCRLVRFSAIPLFAKLPKEKADNMREMGVDVTFCDDLCLCDIPKSEKETALLLANERQAFFLEHDTTEISDEIPCEANMDEVLCEASDEPYDILKIRLETPDDAVAFSNEAHMASLPVMFSSEDEITIMLALMLYQGRALIDSECVLSEEKLKKAVDKYGAVIY